MKFRPSILVICFLFLFAACKKNSSGNGIAPGNPNNVMTGTITATGAQDVVIDANGSYTLFLKNNEVGGDTIITILGGPEDRAIKITLGNINAAGTYDFISVPVTGSRQFAFVDYNIYGFSNDPSASYTTLGTATAGTITITSLTSSHIAGSFSSVICQGSGGTNGSVQIKNVTFKGDF